jgi:hypothetical protein
MKARATKPAEASVERIWRVRKDHTWIDARICDRQGSPRVELAFFYDGARIFSTECPSREVAIDEAAFRLRDLQRAGWNTHW